MRHSGKENKSYIFIRREKGSLLREQEKIHAALRTFSALSEVAESSWRTETGKINAAQQGHESHGSRGNGKADRRNRHR
jgi:hypothetical protein